MNIEIFGCGALGGNLSLLLMQDTRDQHNLTIIDFDKIESRNLNTQPYSAEQVGFLKTDALQYLIYKKTGMQINIINEKITKDTVKQIIFPDSIQSPFGLVVDCLDNFEARSAVTEVCRNVPCIHLGFGKYTWSIFWNEEYQPPENAIEWDICELLGASSFVHMVVAIGSSVIQEYLTTGKKKEFCGNRFSIREII